MTPDYTLARPFDGDACYRWLTNERNIRWLLQYEGNISCTSHSLLRRIHTSELVQRREGKNRREAPIRAEIEEETNKWSYDLLPSAQWMICKDSQGNGYAAKGGHNEENHNHNDVGHFLCVYEGEMLLTDLGAGEYTRDYFGEGRYTILCNRSLGHSVPLINRMEQCAGKEYAADDFCWDDEKKELTISYAKAYPQGCISKVIRKISSEEKKGQFSLCVMDYFEKTDDTKEIVENLVTKYPPVVDKNHILIKGIKGCMEIEISDLEGSIDIISEKFSNHAGDTESVYLLQWKLPMKEDGTMCTMGISCYKITDNN